MAVTHLRYISITRNKIIAYTEQNRFKKRKTKKLERVKKITHCTDEGLKSAIIY